MAHLRDSDTLIKIMKMQQYLSLSNGQYVSSSCHEHSPFVTVLLLGLTHAECKDGGAAPADWAAGQDEEPTAGAGDQADKELIFTACPAQGPASNDQGDPPSCHGRPAEQMCKTWAQPRFKLHGLS